jgi:hypothetical protein
VKKASAVRERIEQLDRVEQHIHENPSDDRKRDRELLEFIDMLRQRAREKLHSADAV